MPDCRPEKKYNCDIAVSNAIILDFACSTITKLVLTRLVYLQVTLIWLDWLAVLIFARRTINAFSASATISNLKQENSPDDDTDKVLLVCSLCVVEQHSLSSDSVLQPPRCGSGKAISPAIAEG